MRRSVSSGSLLLARLAVGTVTVVLAMAAARVLIPEFARLLFEPSAVIPWLPYLGVTWSVDTQSAPDLKTYLGLVQDWFAGVPIYRVGSRVSPAWMSTYPPASYVMLWPLAGWPSEAVARCLWAVVDAVALVIVVPALVREAHPRASLDRAFIGAAILSTAAMGQTIGNGQLGLFVVAALVVVTRVSHVPAHDHAWTRELLVIGLVTLSLVKPSIAAPFFLFVLLGPRGIRRGSAIVCTYAALTVFAALFQQHSLWAMIQEWLSIVHKHGSLVGGDNIHSWLASIGATGAAGPASLVVLSLLGGWLFATRAADPWLRVGVTAIIARVWVYHDWYDDILLLLPLVALYRIANEHERGMRHGWPPAPSGSRAQLRAGARHRFSAWTLFALTLASLVALRAFAPVRHVGGVIWIAALGFLIFHTHVISRDSRAGT